ncbi:MAG TPA: hypothetical protein VGI92_04400 [Gemmatimonadales bacterium]|jgi:hypothetical protein
MQDFMIRDVIEGLTVAATIILVAYSPIFRAFGKRIMHGKTPPEGMTFQVDDARVDHLSGEVAALRQHLDETLDRLDFAERMIAKQRERGLIDAPKNG